MSTAAERTRRLDRVAMSSGQFAILAIDHIESLATTIRPHDPGSVTQDELRQIKVRIVRALAGHVGAVLIDPVIGFLGDRDELALSPDSGLILGIESGDYASGGLVPRLQPGWTVERAAELGADAVKVSFFFDPDGDTSAAETFVEDVLDQCHLVGVPLFAEPLMQAGIRSDRRTAIVEAVKRFGGLGPDVLKIQFPEDVRTNPSAEAWVEACEQVHDASPVPWTLLSEGEDYLRFRELLAVACRAGASGFLVGRAVWREAATGDGDLEQSATRLQELTSIAVAEGRT